VKKKLVLVVTLSYVGGSFSGEPLSPFGENPFAPHTEEHPNPFHLPAQESVPLSFPAPSVPVQDHHSMPAENPFAAGARHEASPFGEVQQEHPQENVGEHVFPHLEPEQVGMHPEPVVELSLLPHEPQQTSEVATEKNPDTGEDATVDSEVDTFEQEGSGNWLLKRVWWEKTEAIYEQIKQVFNDIMNARMDYISQRNRLDRELDIAYGEIGLEEGELQDIIDYCLDFTKKEKTEQGFLTKQEEELHTALEHKQHDLEQIKLDLKALQAVDQKIDEALDILFKQIDVANQYEQKAWDNFKDIARELNDKIARKSYYETEGLLKDIQNVHSYIVTQFSSYFSQTLQTARTHSQNITSHVQSLKQGGLDLKNRQQH
jgi:hypothetical protein